MGALACSPPWLSRLLFPAGVFFLLLLYLCSHHLPELPLSTCLWGGHPCPWSKEAPPANKGEEKLLPRPPVSSAQRPGEDALPVRATADSQFQDSRFQIQRLFSAFTASLTPKREILIREYLKGWKELIKFMDSLGAAFGLISQETQSKISIMEQYQSGKHSHRYHTVQSMVTFELARGWVGVQSLPKGRPPSGCRTLLRLHRALKWLELFLHKLRTSKEDGDPSQMCAEAYSEALAPYHSWWIRQAAALAFLALPSRQELYRIICPEGEPKAQAILLAAVDSISRVYNVTQEEYASHGMLELL